jgi:folylpolyglutamate synthase/dihydropteroate synthase
MTKFIIKYQIIDYEGTYILDAYHNREAAEYMSKYYFEGSSVIEIEIEVNN